MSDAKLDDETENAINAFGRASHNVGHEASAMWSRPVWTEKNMVAREADCAAALRALRQRIHLLIVDAHDRGMRHV